MSIAMSIAISSGNHKLVEYLCNIGYNDLLVKLIYDIDNDYLINHINDIILASDIARSRGIVIVVDKSHILYHIVVRSNINIS